MMACDSHKRISRPSEENGVLKCRLRSASKEPTRGSAYDQ